VTVPVAVPMWNVPWNFALRLTFHPGCTGPYE
jgi:hypothetical protein